MQTLLEEAMREFWRDNKFLEIHSPKLTPAATESGSELFTVPYFGTQACLAQSPQFYKQMAMAAGFDRIFEIGPVFRANPSFTSRHDTEFTSVDMEISWIDSHEDVMKVEETWLAYILSRVAAEYGSQIEEAFGAKVIVPALPFPRITLEEARGVLANQGHIISHTRRTWTQRVSACWLDTSSSNMVMNSCLSPITRLPYARSTTCDRKTIPN